MIVPGWNVAGYAAEALASLQAQTRTDWTALLVDDASTDDTARVFDAAAAQDPRFEVIRSAERVGLGAARNLALDRVRTDAVGFLDADDILVPTAVERLLGVLEQTGSDFAVGAYVRLRPESGGYEVGQVQPWVAAATAPARRSTTLDEHPDVTANVVAWSKISRTEFWRRAHLRFPEGRLYEDQVLAQQMYARTRAFDTIPDVVAHWRIRPDGSSITQREAQVEVLRDCLDAMDAGLRVLETTGHPRAADARAAQILRMDLPRLVRIGRGHPNPVYRHLLGGFARDLWARGARPPLDAEAAASVSAARLW